MLDSRPIHVIPLSWTFAPTNWNTVQTFTVGRLRSVSCFGCSLAPSCLASLLMIAKVVTPPASSMRLTLLTVADSWSASAEMPSVRMNVHGR